MGKEEIIRLNACIMITKHMYRLSKRARHTKPGTCIADNKQSEDSCLGWRKELFFRWLRHRQCGNSTGNVSELG